MANGQQEPQDPTQYLQTASFSLGDAGSSSSAQPSGSETPLTASDLLGGAFDPARLHPLAGLSDKLDYLSLDDDKTNEMPGSATALPSRGWSDDLCYGTGTTYLSGESNEVLEALKLLAGASHKAFSICNQGLAIGGAWGLREGAFRPLAVSSNRLRINSILNSVTRRGSFLGNSAGVLALSYNAINSIIDHWRGKHDVLGSMAAGAATGALYKSTAGVRPAIAAATLMTGAAGIWSYLKRSV